MKSIAEDGEVVRVPAYLMDGVQRALTDGMGKAAGFKPGYVIPSVDPRPQVYADYAARLSDAWRSQPAQPPSTTVDAAYAEYEARLASAWRSGDASA